MKSMALFKKLLKKSFCKKGCEKSSLRIFSNDDIVAGLLIVGLWVFILSFFPLAFGFTLIGLVLFSSGWVIFSFGLFLVFADALSRFPKVKKQ